MGASKYSVFYQRGAHIPNNSVAFSPNGDFFISGSNDSTISLWNIASG
jgi:WD40 repeat protein